MAPRTKKKTTKKAKTKSVAKKTTKKTAKKKAGSKKKKTFTDKVREATAKGKPKPTVENFVVEGSFPAGKNRIVMTLLRPTEESAKQLGSIKAVAFNEDQSFKIWMGGPLGVDIAKQMGARHQMHVWAVQEGGKIRFDTETPIPNEARW